MSSSVHRLFELCHQWAFTPWTQMHLQFGRSRLEVTTLGTSQGDRTGAAGCSHEAASPSAWHAWEECSSEDLLMTSSAHWLFVLSHRWAFIPWTQVNLQFGCFLHSRSRWPSCSISSCRPPSRVSEQVPQDTRAKWHRQVFGMLGRSARLSMCWSPVCIGY